MSYRANRGSDVPVFGKFVTRAVRLRANHPHFTPHSGNFTAVVEVQKTYLDRRVQMDSLAGSSVLMGAEKELFC